VSASPVRAAAAIGELAFAGLVGRLRDAIELTKPRLVGLIGITAIAAAGMACPDAAQWPVIVAASAGITLLAAGGAALAQALEADADARMIRTCDRPIAAGRLSPATGAAIGAALAAAGTGVLAAGTCPAAVALGLVALASYVVVYTPLKQRTPLNTLVGTVPGALPPVIAWVAVSGSLSAGAGMLFLVLVVWQVPHFLALAWMHRDDFARGGMAMLPVADPEGAATARQVSLYSLALVPASLLPAMAGRTGPAYFWAALALSTGFLALALIFALDRSREAARRVFVASLVYLPALLVALLAQWRAP
jgi:protoheme IX farnesyltransferase